MTADYTYDQIVMTEDGTYDLGWLLWSLEGKGYNLMLIKYNDTDWQANAHTGDSSYTVGMGTTLVIALYELWKQVKNRPTFVAASKTLSLDDLFDAETEFENTAGLDNR